MRSLVTAVVWIIGVLAVHPLWAQETDAKAREQTILTQIRDNDLDAALKSIDDAMQANAEVSVAIRQELAMALLKANRTQEAAKQAVSILESTFSSLAEEGNPGPFLRAFPRASVALIRNGEKKEVDFWLNKAILATEAKLSSTEFNQTHLHYSDLLRENLRQLDDKESLAMRLDRLQQHIARSERLFEKDPPDDAAAATMILVWNSGIQLLAPEPAMHCFDKAHALASSRLTKGPTIPVLQAYAGSVSAMISSRARTDPDSAGEALAAAILLLDGLDASDQAIAPTLDTLRKSIQRMEKIVEDSQAILAMIGQTAPDWEPMEWVHGEPETLNGLQGKVILMDFWAVWCGPCIATFPHLKHWSDEYGPRGLTVIGVTRQYNFTWDEETQSAKRSDEPVPLEEELAMLEKFMASHELRHRSMVTSNDSEMHANYKVAGIPHAVLVDKMGKVRMVKIGSGETNAADLEAMIQKLLDE